MPSRCKCLPAAGEEDGEDVEYGVREIRVPVATGWKFKLFLQAMQSPLFPPIKTFVFKNSGVHNALYDTVIPEWPLFEREPFFQHRPEPSTTTIAADQDISARLIVSTDLMSNFSRTLQGPASDEFLRRATVKDYHTAYSQGSCTPLDVARRIMRVLDDWRKCDQKLAWFVSWDENAITQQAIDSSKRYILGKPLSVLDGVPFTVKDLLTAFPYKTSCGTGYIMDRDKPLLETSHVTALKKMGAVLIGKTNMHEIGIGVTGVNNVWGTPMNPWGENRYPGGSSSGAGASTGAGLCPISIGSDGGGSIRIPSSFNGCVGLKPTVGRINDDSTTCQDYSVSTLGPITGCVEDAVLMYALMAQPGRPERNIPPLVLPSLNCNAGPRPLHGMKMGLYSEWFDHSDKDVREVCRRAVSMLEGLGVELVNIKIPDLELLRVAHGITISTEMANATHTDFSNKSTRRKMNGDTRCNLLLSRSFTASDYVQCQRIRRRMSIHFKRVLGDIDFVVTPTTPMTAPMMRKSVLQDPGETNLRLTSKLMRYMAPSNFLGIPSISIPVGKDTAGMPVGLQLIAKHWHEATLLRAAFHLEQRVKNEHLDCNKPKFLVNPLATV